MRKSCPHGCEKSIAKQPAVTTKKKAIMSVRIEKWENVTLPPCQTVAVGDKGEERGPSGVMRLARHRCRRRRRRRRGKFLLGKVPLSHLFFHCINYLFIPCCNNGLLIFITLLERLRLVVPGTTGTGMCRK